MISYGIKHYKLLHPPGAIVIRRGLFVRSFMTFVIREHLYQMSLSAFERSRSK